MDPGRLIRVLQLFKIFGILEPPWFQCCFVLLKIVILPVNQNVVRMSKDIYRIIFLFCWLSSGLTAIGQSEWRSLGPDNLTSPIRSIVYFNDGSNLLAGTQGGGLWRSINQGDSWEPVNSYSEQAMGAGGSPHISDIAVDGDRIYVATGTGQLRIPDNLSANPSESYLASRDGYFGNLAGKPGAGVMVSLDNGNTWETTRNATNPDAITDGSGEPILASNPFHRSGPFANLFTIEARNGLILIGTAQGLYYSNSPTLETVELVAGPEFLLQNAIFDIEFAGEPGNEKIYVVAHLDDFNQVEQVFVADFVSGAQPSFEQIEDDLFADGELLSISIRTEFAVAPSNPNLLYATGANSAGILGVFRKDLRQSEPWERVGPRNSPAVFDPLGANLRESLVLEIFPDNPNEIILAGDRWFTFTEERRWVQTASHGFTGGSAYLPTPINTVTFNPNNPRQFFVGTIETVRASFDRGQTFVGRSKGLESALTYSLASFGFDFDAVSDLDNDAADVVMAGLNSEVVYNANYSEDKPSNQGFGIVSPRDYSRVEASLLYPGALLIQGPDGGLQRSTNRGEVFEAFYGLPIVPGVKGFTGDTLINATAEFSENTNDEEIILENDTSLVLLNRLVEIVNDTLSRVGSADIFGGADSTFSSPLDTLVSPNNDSTFTDTTVIVTAGQITISISETVKVRELSVITNMLGGLQPDEPQAVWALDEVVPPLVLDSMLAEPGADNYQAYTVDELREVAPSYIFYCSDRYLWVVNDAFGDLLQTNWNRLTPALVDGADEQFTAITVSGDTNHTVYLGTSKGNIWRIDRPHDLANFDINENVFHLTSDFDSANLTPTRNRWITDLAIDPKNPNRLAVTYAGYGQFNENNLIPPSSVYLTEEALLSDSLPFFAPLRLSLSTTDPLPNGRSAFLQAYSAAFVEAEGEANSTLLIGCEREMFSISELPDLTVTLGIQGYFLSSDQVVIEFNSGNVPIYDIRERKYTTQITESALTRTVEVSLPGGGTEIREVEFDQILLVEDDMVFVATYGRGVWSSDGFQARRSNNQGSSFDDALDQQLDRGQVKLGPNPAHPGHFPQLYLYPEHSGFVSISVMDLSGRQMYRQGLAIEAGQQVIDLAAAFGALDQGIYLVQTEIKAGDQTQRSTFKVVWQK